MEKTNEELHYASMLRFIELANQLSKEDVPKKVVSAALMTASCVYATYTEVGNKGMLNKDRVNKVVESYRKQLEHTQQIRQETDRKQKEQKEQKEQKIDETAD